MTVEELIEKLETYPSDMLVRSGTYDTWQGQWILSRLCIEVLLTDENGGRDLTDKERDRDIETLILY